MAREAAVRWSFGAKRFLAHSVGALVGVAFIFVFRRTWRPLVRASFAGCLESAGL